MAKNGKFEAQVLIVTNDDYEQHCVAVSYLPYDLGFEDLYSTNNITHPQISWMIPIGTVCLCVNHSHHIFGRLSIQKQITI